MRWKDFKKTVEDAGVLEDDDVRVDDSGYHTINKGKITVSNCYGKPRDPDNYKTQQWTIYPVLVEANYTSTVGRGD